jgi:hypothetical protein
LHHQWAHGNASFKDSVKFTNLLGSATIDHSSISGGWADNLEIVNNTGTLDRLTVTNTTFGAINPSAANNGANDSFFFGNPGSGGATKMNVTVDHCTFTSAPGDLFNTDAEASVVMDVVFTNNTLSDNFPAAQGGGGITITGGGSGSTEALTFNVAHNTLRDALGIEINVSKQGGAGTFQGTIDSNTTGVSGVANSGGNGGIQAHGSGTGTFSISITNNTVQHQQHGPTIRGTLGRGRELCSAVELERQHDECDDHR